MAKIIDYVRDTRAEMRHVKWPTRRETIAHASIVVALSVIVAVFLGVFDRIFVTLLKAFVI